MNQRLCKHAVWPPPYSHQTEGGGEATVQPNGLIIFIGERKTGSQCFWLRCAALPGCSCGCVCGGGSGVGGGPERWDQGIGHPAWLLPGDDHGGGSPGVGEPGCRVPKDVVQVGGDVHINEVVVAFDIWNPGLNVDGLGEDKRCLERSPSSGSSRQAAQVTKATSACSVPRDLKHAWCPSPGVREAGQEAQRGPEKGPALKKLLSSFGGSYAYAAATRFLKLRSLLLISIKLKEKGG